MIIVAEGRHPTAQSSIITIKKGLNFIFQALSESTKIAKNGTTAKFSRPRKSTSRDYSEKNGEYKP